MAASPRGEDLAEAYKATCKRLQLIDLELDLEKSKVSKLEIEVSTLRKTIDAIADNTKGFRRLRFKKAMIRCLAKIIVASEDRKETWQRLMEWGQQAVEKQRLQINSQLKQVDETNDKLLTNKDSQLSSINERVEARKRARNTARTHYVKCKKWKQVAWDWIKRRREEKRELHSRATVFLKHLLQEAKENEIRAAEKQAQLANFIHEDKYRKKQREITDFFRPDDQHNPREMMKEIEKLIKMLDTCVTTTDVIRYHRSNTLVGAEEEITSAEVALETAREMQDELWEEKDRLEDNLQAAEQQNQILDTRIKDLDEANAAATQKLAQEEESMKRTLVALSTLELSNLDNQCMVEHMNLVRDERVAWDAIELSQRNLLEGFSVREEISHRVEYEKSLIQDMSNELEERKLEVLRMQEEKEFHSTLSLLQSEQMDTYTSLVGEEVMERQDHILEYERQLEFLFQRESQWRGVMADRGNVEEDEGHERQNISREMELTTSAMRSQIALMHQAECGTLQVQGEESMERQSLYASYVEEEEKRYTQASKQMDQRLKLEKQWMLNTLNIVDTEIWNRLRIYDIAIKLTLKPLGASVEWGSMVKQMEAMLAPVVSSTDKDIWDSDSTQSFVSVDGDMEVPDPNEANGSEPNGSENGSDGSKDGPNGGENGSKDLQDGTEKLEKTILKAASDDAEPVDIHPQIDDGSPGGKSSTGSE